MFGHFNHATNFMNSLFSPVFRPSRIRFRVLPLENFKLAPKLEGFSTTFLICAVLCAISATAGFAYLIFKPETKIEYSSSNANALGLNQEPLLTVVDKPTDTLGYAPPKMPEEKL